MSVEQKPLNLHSSDLLMAVEIVSIQPSKKGIEETKTEIDPDWSLVGEEQVPLNCIPGKI